MLVVRAVRREAGELSEMKADEKRDGQNDDVDSQIACILKGRSREKTTMFQGPSNEWLGSWQLVWHRTGLVKEHAGTSLTKKEEEGHQGAEPCPRKVMLVIHVRTVLGAPFGCPWSL